MARIRSPGGGAEPQVYWLLWGCVMVYVMCACYRLARFNGILDDERLQERWKDFFQGVPSPAAAGIVMTPIILDSYFGTAMSASDWLSGGVLVFAGAMMVSHLPTFSLKAAWVPRWAQITTIVAAVCLNALLTPVYLASIPVCYILFRRRQNK
ncbi:MAG: hypothetical protein FWF84_00980 [Kiritimatiellaeota bacterium]|nr:hypothetical protein [Kiritimatiellota bacterium]